MDWDLSKSGMVQKTEKEKGYLVMADQKQAGAYRSEVNAMLINCEDKETYIAFPPCAEQILQSTTA